MIAERRIEMVSQTIKVIDAHTHVFPDKIADKSRNYVGVDFTDCLCIQ